MSTSSPRIPFQQCSPVFSSPMHFSDALPLPLAPFHYGRRSHSDKPACRRTSRSSCQSLLCTHFMNSLFEVWIYLLISQLMCHSISSDPHSLNSIETTPASVSSDLWTSQSLLILLSLPKMLLHDTSWLSLKTQCEGHLASYNDAPTASFPRLGQIPLVSPVRFIHNAIRTCIVLIFYILASSSIPKTF